MNIWENAVITAKGLSLLSKLVEGNTLKITRAESGAGYVTPGLLVQQTYVTMPKQSLTFGPATYPEEGKCKVTCYITNDKLSTGYTAKQIGIYATDPDDGEILFFIAQSTSDKGTEVPSEAEMPGYSAEWTFYFQYGQADGVTVNVDATNMISREEFNAFEASMEKALEAKVEKDGDKVLSSNDYTDEEKEKLANAISPEDFDNLSEDVDTLKQKIGEKNPIVYASSEDGVDYYAIAEGITELYKGLEIILIPGKTSEYAAPTLFINDLQSIITRQTTDGVNSILDFSGDDNWLIEGCPVQLIYDGRVWKTALAIPTANSLRGTLPISKGGTGGTTKEKALENLGLKAETWTFTLEDDSTVTKAVYVK